MPNGKRKFILIEMENYANTITAEKIRKVIQGVKKAKNETLKKGLGGTFSYFEFGETIEMEKRTSLFAKMCTSLFTKECTL